MKRTFILLQIVLVILVSTEIATAALPKLHKETRSNRVQSIERLLNFGYKVDLRSSKGFTALHVASLKGHLSAAETLLSYGADINARSKDGITPILLASYSGNQELVETLRLNGADPSARDHKGRGMNAWAKLGHKSISVNSIQQPKKKKTKFKVSGSLGAGFGVSPRYEGAYEHRLVMVPGAGIQLSYGRVFATFGLIGVNAIQTEHFSLGLGIGLEPGRSTDDIEQLKGLGDIDLGANATAFGGLSYAGFSLSSIVRQDLSGNHSGMLADFTLSYGFSLVGKLTATPSAGVSFATANYNQTFFGISQQQANNSVYNPYEVGGGLNNYNLGIGLTYPINQKWVINASYQFKHLLFGVADSPIVESLFQHESSAVISYVF